jgi:hypothetical protein
LNSYLSFARFSTDDMAANMRGYVGQGQFIDDSLNTFGGVVEIAHMQKLLRHICENDFEHQVAANLSAEASRLGYVLARVRQWSVLMEVGAGIIGKKVKARRRNERLESPTVSRDQRIMVGGVEHDSAS